jgi:hypothetical protein
MIADLSPWATGLIVIQGSRTVEALMPSIIETE